jgi:hypothetical protein
MSIFTIPVPQGPLVNALRRGALGVLGRLKPLQPHPPPCISRHILKLHHLTVVTSRRGLRGIMSHRGTVNASAGGTGSIAIFPRWRCLRGGVLVIKNLHEQNRHDQKAGTELIKQNCTV